MEIFFFFLEKASNIRLKTGENCPLNIDVDFRGKSLTIDKLFVV